MSANHLTPSQANVLAAMRLGYKLRYQGGLNSYCWLNTEIYQRVSVSAYALERAGLIERFNEKASGCEFRLTEKGKKA